MIYITGDTHGSIDIGKLTVKRWPRQNKLTRNDYIIICGDFGNVWNNRPEELYWRKWLDDKPFTTLFVDGNHEGYFELTKFPVEQWNGGKIHRIMSNVIHLMRGQVFNIDGTKIFTMGGASSHDKEWRTEGVSWWPEELPSDEEYEDASDNLKSIGWGVDLVISHCAPDSVQSKLADWYEHDKLTNFLQHVVMENLKYKHWYFGHYHIDREIDDKHTVVYDKIIRW